MLKKLLFGGESGLSFAANLGITILRIFAGASLAIAHGFGKLPVKPGFIENTANLGFPMPAVFAWAAALSEFLGGIFLALGVFTRISGFFIAFTMFIAAFIANAGKGFEKQELALFYLVVGLVFLLKGAGDWSLDAVFRRR